VLQHGSLLLRRSSAAPELPGLADLFATCPDAEELQSRWLARLQLRLAFTWQIADLDAADRNAAEKLAAQRYAGEAWTLTRQKG
jgi:hypothetical protein